MSNTKKIPGHYTLPQAARYVGTSAYKLGKLVSQGLLEGVEVNGTIYLAHGFEEQYSLAVDEFSRTYVEKRGRPRTDKKVWDGRKHVYALHTDDGVFRYIGRTNNVTQRLLGHLSDARTGVESPRCDWMREVGEENVRITTLESFVETKERTAADVEAEYIAKYVETGQLLNRTQSTNGWGSIVVPKEKNYLPYHHQAFHYDEPREGCEWC